MSERSVKPGQVDPLTSGIEPGTEAPRSTLNFRRRPGSSGAAPLSSLFEALLSCPVGLDLRRVFPQFSGRNIEAAAERPREARLSEILT